MSPNGSSKLISGTAGTLGDIAVIVRNGGQLSQLQRYLSGQGIPVRIPVAESAVRDEVAVRPLLDAYAVALDPAVAHARIRRVAADIADRRRHVDRTAQAAAVAPPGGTPGRRRTHQRRPAGGGAAGARRAGARWAWGPVGAPRRADDPGRPGGRRRNPGPTPRPCCGRSGTPPAWPAAWTGPPWPADSAGARADRDLDAMMALFHTAERYVDQLPGSGPEQFLEYLLNQELPMDTLAARAQVDDAVELMTPASAAGREWPVVIVARPAGRRVAQHPAARGAARQHPVRGRRRTRGGVRPAAGSAQPAAGDPLRRTPQLFHRGLPGARRADLHGRVLGGRAALLVPGLRRAAAARARSGAAIPRWNGP